MAATQRPVSPSIAVSDDEWKRKMNKVNEQEQERKKQKTTALVLRGGKRKEARWGFVYYLTDPYNNPFYVGQTENEQTRKARHQDAVSKCTEVREKMLGFINTSNWSFSKNFHRIPQLLHGAPKDKLDLYECYFILKMPNKHGEEVGTYDPSKGGANLRQGPKFTKHKHDFDALETALSELKGGESLHSQADAEKAKMTLLLENELENGVVKHIMEMTKDEDGVPLKTVQETSTALQKIHQTLTNIDKTNELIKALLKIEPPYSDEIIKHLNCIKALQKEYTEDTHNPEQGFSHHCFKKVLKQAVIYASRENGDSERKLLTRGIVVSMHRGLRLHFDARESTGRPSRSVQSVIAWLRDNRLKERTAEVKLSKLINVHLKNPLYTEAEIELLRVEKERLEKEVKEKRHQNTITSGSSYG